MYGIYDKFEHERIKVVRETNSFNTKPVSFEVFKNSKEEKYIIKSEKNRWRAAMRKHYGKTWRKYNNVPS